MEKDIIQIFFKNLSLLWTIMNKTACWDPASKLKIICLDAKEMEMHKMNIDDISVLFYMFLFHGFSNLLF